MSSYPRQKIKRVCAYKQKMFLLSQNPHYYRKFSVLSQNPYYSTTYFSSRATLSRLFAGNETNVITHCAIHSHSMTSQHAILLFNWDQGSAVISSCGVWGGAPAETEFGAC